MSSGANARSDGCHLEERQAAINSHRREWRGGSREFGSHRRSRQLRPGDKYPRKSVRKNLHFQGKISNIFRPRLHEEMASLAASNGRRLINSCPLGCSKMLAKSFIWLMVTTRCGCSCSGPVLFAVTERLFMLQSFLMERRGETFPIVTTHRCCSGDCDNGTELIGAYSCSCEISAETVAIDSAPKLSLNPDLLVASRKTPERVKNRLSIPLTRGVEPVRKCSWQAFACVWRK
jgi:hypothetical protein